MEDHDLDIEHHQCHNAPVEVSYGFLGSLWRRHFGGWPYVGRQPVPPRGQNISAICISLFFNRTTSTMGLPSWPLGVHVIFCRFGHRANLVTSGWLGWRKTLIGNHKGFYPQESISFSCKCSPRFSWTTCSLSICHRFGPWAQFMASLAYPIGIFTIPSPSADVTSPRLASWMRTTRLVWYAQILFQSQAPLVRLPRAPDPRAAPTSSSSSTTRCSSVPGMAPSSDRSLRKMAVGWLKMLDLQGFPW